MYTSQRFPPHLQYVATLPCESQKSKNVSASSLVLVNAYKCAKFQLPSSISYGDMVGVPK